MENNKEKKIKLKKKKKKKKGGEKEPGRGKNFLFRSKREKLINYVELGLY